MITVNRSSNVRAIDWVQRIGSEHRIPAIIRNAIHLRGDAIDVVPVPPGRGVQTPAWFQGLVLASNRNNWEITTAEIVRVRTLTEGASSRLIPDLANGGESQIGYRIGSGGWQPQQVMSHHEPGMVRTLYGVTIPSEQMAAPLLGEQYWRREGPSDSAGPVDHDQSRFLRDSDGENRIKLVQDSVASGRGLIIIGTRPVEPLEVLIPLLHELAVHAGRFSLSVADRSIGWLHGDFVVEAWTRDIDRLRYNPAR